MLCCDLLLYRYAYSTNPHDAQVNIVQQALQYVAKHNRFGDYYRRNNGFDHVIALTHDFGACLDFRDHGKVMMTALGCNRKCISSVLLYRIC